MISRKKILSCSQNDLSCDSGYDQGEEDVWYQKKTLYKVRLKPSMKEAFSVWLKKIRHLQPLKKTIYKVILNPTMRDSIGVLFLTYSAICSLFFLFFFPIYLQTIRKCLWLDLNPRPPVVLELCHKHCPIFETFCLGLNRRNTLGYLKTTETIWIKIGKLKSKGRNQGIIGCID